MVQVDQIGKELDGNTWYQQVISAYHSRCSRRLTSLSRDHPLPPSREVQSVLRPNPRQWLPNGHPPTELSASQARATITAPASRSEHTLTRSVVHFPWWTRVEPRLARGQLSGNSSSSTGGNSSPCPPRRMASRHARMELVLERIRQG